MTHASANGSGRILNSATRAIVATLGVIFAVSVFGHGFFEALQGNTPTGGTMIHAIGAANRFWAQGNEPAFTLIPNFLITGIAAMLCSIAIIVWSIGFLHKKRGSLIFLCLFILSTLVGGGIGQVLFFTIAWAFSTRIHKPLKGWRKILPDGLRRVLGRLWRPTLIISSAMILYALIVAVFGFVPGVTNPDTITVVMLSSLGLGLGFLIIAFISGFSHDIEKEGSASGKTHSGGVCL